MKIIIRNRPFLFISQVLLASYLPVQFTSAHAASASLEEAPPPWAARQNVQVAAPLPASAPPAAEAVVAAQPKRQQTATATATGNSMEQWYAKRQAYVAQPQGSATALQAKATQGDLNAQYALALQLRQDPNPANIEQSLKLQEKAARSGHIEAQYGLGVMYSNGQYLPMDQGLANFWYNQAAKRGSEAAKLALANGSHEAKSVVNSTSGRSLQAPRPASMANDDTQVASAANASMFTATESPEQVQATDASVMSEQEYVALEAETTMSPAEGVAGAEGAPETDAGVIEEPGDISVEHHQSKVDLGNMSVQEVIDSAQKGDMYAQLMLGALFEDGSDSAIPQNIAEAVKWYAKAANQGYPKAQHNLALLYEDGRGVKQSYTEAAKWYAKAAKAGFSEAQNNLAVLYIMGNGVKQDRTQAEKLLTAAVGQGNENARRNLQKLLEGTAS